MNLVKGQLVQVTSQEESTWEYGVVTDVYDECFLIYGRSGRRFKIPTNWDFSKYVTLRHKNGQPVIGKKTLFGSYKFPKRAR